MPAEKKNTLIRARGGALKFETGVANDQRLSDKTRINFHEKARIGKKAATMVAESDSLNERGMPQGICVSLDLHQQALLADTAGAIHGQHQCHVHRGARIAADDIDRDRHASQ